jgi:hypothetical protein
LGEDITSSYIHASGLLLQFQLRGRIGALRERPHKTSSDRPNRARFTGTTITSLREMENNCKHLQYGATKCGQDGQLLHYLVLMLKLWLPWVLLKKISKRWDYFNRFNLVYHLAKY